MTSLYEHPAGNQAPERGVQGFRSDAELEKRLRDAAALGGSDALASMKKDYEARYPGEQEAIEALFGVVRFLDTDKGIGEAKKRDGIAPRELYRAQTEYNFTLAHFVKVNGDKQFLAGFWDLLRSVGNVRDTKDGELVEKLRASVVTQVAVAKAFEALGAPTAISHPDEDAFRATDLWVEEHPVQIAGKRFDTPEFVEVDAVTYPAVTVGDERRGSTYTSHFDDKIDRFGFKLKQWGERTGRELHGYFVAVPYAMVDWDTGDPAPELIDYFREHAPDRPEPVRKAA